MITKLPLEIEIPHEKASDYKLYSADGLFFRLYGELIGLQFYADDPLVTKESFKLNQNNTYEGSGVDNVNRRIDLFSVRLPIQSLLDTVKWVLKERPELADMLKDVTHVVSRS